LGQADGNAVAEKRIDFTYDAVGQYDAITYYDDLDGGTANLVMTAAYSYDDLGRLTALTYADSSSATIRGFAWTYNALGEITSHDSDISSEDVTAYTYDDLGQLQSANYASSADESYAYDATGNRVTANGDTYSTGDANQTTSDGTYSYIYDDEGNLQYKYIDEDSSGTLNTDDSDVTQYGWDSRNQLTEAVHRDLFGGTIDWKADYQYDAMNHRVASLYDDNGDGVTDRVERYVWDGDRIVLDFVDSDGDNNSLNNGTESAPLTLATRYLWGPSVDQLLAQETIDDGGVEDVSYIVRDNLGSTRSLVDSDGDIVSTFSYDTYGNVSVVTGTLTDTRFLYTCQEYDARLGLYYYNARWYDSSIGKFISEDPIGYKGGIDLYEYVGNNPVDKADPTGNLCQIATRCGPAAGGLGTHCGLVVRDDMGTYAVDGSGGFINHFDIEPAPEKWGTTGAFATYTDSTCACLFSRILRWNNAIVPRDTLEANSNWALHCLLGGCGLAIPWAAGDAPVGWNGLVCLKWATSITACGCSVPVCVKYGPRPCPSI